MSELKPIEYDKGFNRTYIPMPGGFEVQTKGKGSSFRIYDGANDFRLPISPQPYLFDILERMARASHEAIAASQQREAELLCRLREVERGYLPEPLRRLMNEYRLAPLDWDTLAQWYINSLKSHAQLQARLDAAEKDAARYRFLAEGSDDAFEVTQWLPNGMQELYITRTGLDKAIDDALTPTVSADEKGEGE